MLKLLGKSSSINVRKVLWVCAELQLAVEHEEWGSGFKPTETPEFLALNPNAMVPVIQDGEFVLWESNTICRYLAGRERREDLLPTAPAGRASVEKWMDWQATELNTSWRYAFLSLVRKSPAHADPQAIAEGIAGWNRHMQILDRQLDKTGAYVAGAAFTLADVVLGVSTNRWLLTPMTRPTLPAVDAWYTRMRAKKGFQLYVDNGIP